MADDRPKTRITATDIRVDPNIRALRVYPIPGTDRPIADLQTVGVRLSKEQAIHLARVLLAVSQDWDEIEITAHRHERRKSDGSFRITVTSRVKTP
jgi:hypothetical protein